MGFLKKLLGIGATAATTVAAVRVSDKYKENNPNGVGDLNGDGVVDAKDVLIGVKNAAVDVYNEAKETVKEKAPETYSFVENVVEEVKTTAADVKEEVKEVFADVKEEVKETAAEVVQGAKDVYEEVKGETAETAAEAVEAVEKVAAESTAEPVEPNA